MEGSGLIPEESEALLLMSLPDQGCYDCPFTVRIEHGRDAPVKQLNAKRFPPSLHDTAAALLPHGDQLPRSCFCLLFS